MECSTTRNRYSVHWSRAIKIPPINPYMRTWRFISCRRIRYRNYRTRGGVDPTACGARSTKIAITTDGRETFVAERCPIHGSRKNSTASRRSQRAASPHGQTPKLFFSDKFPSELLFETAGQSADAVNLVTLS